MMGCLKKSNYAENLKTVYGNAKSLTSDVCENYGITCEQHGVLAKINDTTTTFDDVSKAIVEIFIDGYDLDFIQDKYGI